MLTLFIIAIVVVYAAAADKSWTQMEPSVNTFSSKQWLMDPKFDFDSAMINAVFVLKHDSQKMKQFESQLLQLATPSSQSYGKWQKLKEIKEQIAPDEESLQSVLTYINSFGITSSGKGSVKVSDLKDKVFVKMPLKVADEMFNTKFSVFKSAKDNRVVLPRITQPYFLPSDIAEKVAIVDDIMRFPSVGSNLEIVQSEVTTNDDSAFSSCGTRCSGFTTPEVLREAYNISPVTKATPGNSMSVAEFQLQYYDNKDLSSFSDACDVTVTVDETIGGNVERICEAGGCVEALLDIEYIGAISHPIPLTVIYLSTFSLLDWVDQVITMENPPLVHSVSYGNDEVQQTSVEYMETVNEQFMVAGTMGLSILFASGDQGVWGRSGVGRQFNPDFPAASPYVTAVGGTDFKKKSVIGEESTWSCGGGGFSNTFPMPEWQEDAVKGYLASAAKAGVLPSSSNFNSTGRAYPDVAALGGQVNPYCVGIKGGSFSGVAGTSASCPVVAGVFAQVNNARLAAGKSSLGWLNPLIYSSAGSQCFNDVKDGSKNNCYANTEGFATIAGWDAATGFGTPNAECLMAL